ncbi:hypothetical protein PM082_021480 [Marasmius tenuissimus]|nr:hypothetical protein PM082_021480 [Marasmius tenuissimus]
MPRPIKQVSVYEIVILASTESALELNDLFHSTATRVCVLIDGFSTSVLDHKTYLHSEQVHFAPWESFIDHANEMLMNKRTRRHREAMRICLSGPPCVDEEVGPHD